MKKKKRKPCELQEFGKNKSHLRYFGTPRSNSHKKINMTMAVEGRQSDVLYTNFLHPIYGSNDNLRPNQENKKVKKKQTIFKRIQNIFSKNNNLKSENKNSKPQLPLKKYNDSFVLPHLQNTYITQNFTTPKTSNTSRSEEANKTVDEINSIKNSNCAINTENDIKPTEEIKEVRSKSEIGIQTVLNGNENESPGDSLLKDSKIPELNNKEDSLEVLYKEQVFSSSTTSLETKKKSPEKKLYSEKSNNLLGNLHEEKTHTSNDSIYTISFTNQKPAAFEKSHTFESENRSRKDTTEPCDGAKNRRRIHSISDDDEMNSQKRWSMNYEQNDLSSDSDDTLQKRKNTHYSLPETKQFEKLKEEYNNNLSKSRVKHKETKSLKSHNNYSKTEDIFSSFNQTCLNQQISRKESSQSDRSYSQECVSEKNCKNTEIVFSSSINDHKNEETIKKVPLFSQPDNPIPMRQCYGPPKTIWSRAASPFNMEVEKIPNMRLLDTNDNILALDSSNKLHSSFNRNDETKSGETHTNVSSEWIEEDSNSQAREKKITVMKANSLDNESPSRLNVFKTPEFTSNFKDRKSFPTLSDDLNIFEKCRKRETEHSGLNISLQQFKDLKNNLCITLCSSTLYDDEHKIFKNTYNNLQFEDDFKLPNLANSENSKGLDLLKNLKESSERSITTAKSIIGSTSTFNNSYAASQKYNEINEENISLKGNKNIKTLNLSHSKQTVKTSSSRQGMAGNNCKKSTHINKLLDPGVKKTLPLNGFIRLNKNNEVLNKSSKDNQLNGNSKRRISDSASCKTSQRNMPHGAFSGNISGSSNKTSLKSAKKTKKNK